MKKENYREKVEEHRQEIELNQELLSKTSRSSRHKRPEKQRNQSNFWMKILVFIFIFIPAGCLCYVWAFYEPDVVVDELEITEENNKFEMQKQDVNSTSAAGIDEEEEEESSTAKETETKEQLAAELAAKEIAAAEAAQKIAVQKLQGQQGKDKATADAKATDVKKKAEEAKALEKKKKAEQAQAKSHTVQSTDNLYRIALKYYGDGGPGNIAKVKQANGLSSDAISAGQVLIIPQ